jgi:predicted Zn-dependent protease
MSARLAILALAFTLVSCATSPLGRDQLLIFSDGQMQQLGAQAYAEMQRKEEVSRDPAVNRYVRCVAQAITRALPGRYRDEAWEVTVFEDRSANAFALPGGKIGVNTGMLRVATSQDELAAVVAHEVAHVIARHGAERMSQQFATQTGLDLIRVFSGAPSPTKDTVLGVLGIGARYGILLPYSRAQESEADLFGVDLMAQAGFDPRASVSLWSKMARSGGGQSAEFLSTHPSHQTRVRDLEARIPAALPRYRKVQAAGVAPRCGL